MKPVSYTLIVLLLAFGACKKNAYTAPAEQHQPTSPTDSSNTGGNDSTTNGDTTHVAKIKIVDIAYEGSYFNSHYNVGMMHPYDTTYTAILKVRKTIIDSVIIMQTNFMGTGYGQTDTLKSADKQTRYFSKSDGRNGYFCTVYGDSISYMKYMHSSMIGMTWSFKGVKQVKDISVKNTY